MLELLKSGLEQTFVYICKGAWEIMLINCKIVLRFFMVLDG